MSNIEALTKSFKHIELLSIAHDNGIRLSTKDKKKKSNIVEILLQSKVEMKPIVFNQPQQALLSMDDPRILVNAGPGTGKTRVAIELAIKNKNSFLIISFSRAARKVVVERLEALRIPTMTSYKRGIDRCACTIDSLVHYLNIEYEFMCKENMNCHSTDKSFLQKRIDVIEYLKTSPDLALPNLIILDEAQDTTDEQWQLLELFWKSAKQVIVLGDPRQTIMQGASKRFIELWQGETWTNHAFDQNYRSTEHILSMVNAISQEMGPLHVELCANREPGLIPEVIGLHTKDDSEVSTNDSIEVCEKIAFSIEKHIANDVPLHEILIVSPTIDNTCGSSAPALRGILSKMGIPSIQTDSLEKDMNGNYETWKDVQGKVIISNTHQIKGGEFEVVILLEFDKRFPYRSQGEEQARYLFYVACSRAKSVLEIYYSKGATRFLNGLNKYYISKEPVVFGELSRKPSFRNRYKMKDIAVREEKLHDLVPIKQVEMVKEFRGCPCPNGVHAMFYGMFVENVLIYRYFRKIPMMVAQYAEGKLLTISVKKYNEIKHLLINGSILAKDGIIQGYVAVQSNFNAITKRDREFIRNLPSDLSIKDLWRLTFYDTLLRNAYCDRSVLSRYSLLSEQRFTNSIEKSLKTIDDLKCQYPKGICNLSFANGIPDLIGEDFVLELKASDSDTASEQFKHQVHLYALSLGKPKCYIFNFSKGELIRFNTLLDERKTVEKYIEQKSLDNYVDNFCEWVYGNTDAQRMSKSDNLFESITEWLKGIYVDLPDESSLKKLLDAIVGIEVPVELEDDIYKSAIQQIIFEK